VPSDPVIVLLTVVGVSSLAATSRRAIARRRRTGSV
jgi:hypothetical protein